MWGAIPAASKNCEFLHSLFGGFLFALQGSACGRLEPLMMMFFLRFDWLVIAQ
jgi:hypothetical protein